MNSERLIRIMSIAETIRKEPGINYKDLSEDFDVSERTIRRDIDVLEEAGFPVQYYNGLRFMSDVELPRVEFSPDEVIFLLLMIDFMARYEIESEVPHNLFDKLKDYLPEKMMNKYQKIQKSILIHPHKNRKDGREAVKRLKEIIQSQNRIEIYYHSHSSKETTWRKVDPYGVFFKNRSWYMIAYCHNHHEIRIFRCNRIKEIKSLPEKYKIPRGFDQEEFLSGSFDIMKGEPTIVKIRFDEEVAPFIEEATFSYYEKKTRVKDKKGLIYEVKVDNWREVFSWVLSFGSMAEVIEPYWMREKIVEEIEKIENVYGKMRRL